MTRRRDPALAALLQEAARETAFPETPALAASVRERIERGPMPVAEVRLPRTRPPLLRPVLVTLLAIAVALGVTLSISVTARRAVADLLGVVGIRITFGDDPPGSPTPARRIRLGDAVPRKTASELAGFRVLVPGAAAGRPAIYFDRRVGDRGMVTVVYPRAAETLADVDLLVSEFVASLPAEYVKKLGTLGSRITYTDVRGVPAYWVSGDPHYFFFTERNGAVRQETIRLAGNVLLWEEDGVTFRVEGAGSLQEARRLAESLR